MLKQILSSSVKFGRPQGQPGGSVSVNLYPAIAAANYPNIIVFGSVDTCGEEASDSQQGPLVSGGAASKKQALPMRRAWFLGFMALNPARFPEPGTVRTAGAVKNRITEEA
ncbi:hypothetical protein HO173_011967 [Letharia columbiana]|uniref:Uncharacterized protein n=1 Tax=Letharia columbiana TaxID=112416 RepID=A0A8H6FH95_9LECA|nr:uncharacterized protein HO173_011967 [Letharia columbiana]KAF6227749.1 hypothetical protein HO173_011967 [Letharia columbiana]